MKFQVLIDCGNDVFVVAPENEVAAILRDIANKVENGMVFLGIIDSNGNKVGDWGFDSTE